MSTVSQTVVKVDQLELHRLFDAITAPVLKKCDSLPHATRMGDDMRLQLPRIIRGEQASFEGLVGPHLCAEKDRPFSCAHRVNHSTGGFDPEFDQLERIGVPVPESLIIQNQRFRQLLSIRDGMAHRIGGLAADQNLVEEHKRATAAASAEEESIHRALVDLIRKYFVNIDTAHIAKQLRDSAVRPEIIGFDTLSGGSIFSAQYIYYWLRLRLRDILSPQGSVVKTEILFVSSIY